MTRYVKNDHENTGHINNRSVTWKKVKYNITISTGISEAAYLTTMLTMQSKYYAGTLIRKSAPTLSLPLMCSTLRTKLFRANTQRIIRGLSNLETFRNPRAR